MNKSLVILAFVLLAMGCVENNGEKMEKRIAMIIAHDGFQDVEFSIPYRFFNDHGAKVEVFSNKNGTATGAFGLEAEVNGTLDQLKVDDYDAIVFIGGPGTPTLRKEARALEIAQEAVKKGKVLGAICWSPTILAKAGVLNGINATVWLGNDSEYGMTTNMVLAKYGANYAGQDLIIDGKIVTANGPPAAEKYAKAIWDLLG
jgi:protease I